MLDVGQSKLWLPCNVVPVGYKLQPTVSLLQDNISLISLGFAIPIIILMPGELRGSATNHALEMVAVPCQGLTLPSRAGHLNVSGFGRGGTTCVYIL